MLPLDCDDALAPSYLAEVHAALSAAPADVGFVFTHLRAFGAVDVTDFPRRYNAFELLFSNKLQSCIFMRRSMWERLGGYDEAMRDGYEDWDFNIRMSRAGIRAIEIPKPLYLSREQRRHAAQPLLGAPRPIWRYIRAKHSDAYRLPEIMRVWRETREWTHAASGRARYSHARAVPGSLVHRDHGSVSLRTAIHPRLANKHLADQHARGLNFPTAC